MYLLRSPMRRVCSGYNLSWTPRTPRTPRRLLIRCPSCLGTLVSTLWSGSPHGVHHHGWSAPMDCIRLPIWTSDWWRERRYTVGPDVGGLPRTASLWSNSAVLRYWRIQQRKITAFASGLRPGCVRASIHRGRCVFRQGLTTLCPRRHHSLVDCHCGLRKRGRRSFSPIRYNS